MNILIGCLYVVEVLVCLMLALVVMLQKPKEGGLGGAIAGGGIEASLGADAGNVLIRTTTILGIIFLVNTLVLARLTATGRSGSVVIDQANQAAQQIPVPGAVDLPTEAPVEAPIAPVEAPAETK